MLWLAPPDAPWPVLEAMLQAQVDGLVPVPSMRRNRRNAANEQTMLPTLCCWCSPMLKTVASRFTCLRHVCWGPEHEMHTCQGVVMLILSALPARGEGTSGPLPCASVSCKVKRGRQTDR